MKPFDEEQELTRLLAQETSPLASSLGALRDQGPDAAQLASLASRLALQGLDVSVSRPPPPLANPWKKWGWGGLGGVSAVIVWLALRGSQPVPHGAQPAAHVVADMATASVAVVEPGASAQPRARVADARTALAEEPTADVEAARVPPTNATTKASGVAPSPLVEAATGATSPGSPRGDVRGSVNSPTNPSVASARAGVASVAGETNSSAPASAGDLAPASEIELLRDARLLLRQSPARALELTEEHGRLYPRGKMTQERELIAVSALVALGRRTAALSRAASFERQFPTSPYRKQISDLLR